MKEFYTVLRTNENGARTKTLIAAGITVVAIAAGIYLTKKNSVVPVNLVVVEEVVDTVTDAVKA